MSYNVTAPLAIIPNVDKVTGDGYFYADSIVPDGWNDDRCKQLVKDGMLEKAKVKPAKSAELTGPNPGTAEFILNEVGDDKGKAQAALDEENAEEKPRVGLVASLEKILAG